MESWSYVSGVKNFGIGNVSMLFSEQDGIQNQELDKLHSSENWMKNSPSGGTKFGFGRVHSQLPAASWEESSTIVKSDSRDSTLVDLKLGRFLDHKGAQMKANVSFSRAESSSSMPAKKARVAASLGSQRPYCQVHGCRKDLSSSKDYHKRHKVCEFHSKTTKVIVNEVEQRFCQQCSRFHLLAEFDDGKRSCRKSLASHNERRRKPHIGMRKGRGGTAFQSYNGTRFEGTSSVLSSFVCQDILPSGLLQTEKYEMNDWYRHTKAEGRADCRTEQPVFPSPRGQTPAECSFGSDKQCSSFRGDGLNAMTRTKTNEKNNPFMDNVTTLHLEPHPVLHNTTLGREQDSTVLDSSSAVQGLSAVSSNGCALSLLSSQSQKSSNHSSGIPTGIPLITPSGHAHYIMTQVSERLTRVSPQVFTTGVSNKFSSFAMSSANSQMEPILISDCIDSVNYGISRIIPVSGYMNTKNHLGACEDGSTIDLLQLSSQLQRVEHQRQYVQTKEENDAVFGLRIMQTS